MSKPADTNQASEDELNTRIKELLIALLLMNQRDSDGIDEYADFCIRDAKKLIRTEKLKLLAEVRERAIPNPTTPAGENEFVSLEALNKMEAEL